MTTDFRGSIAGSAEKLYEPLDRFIQTVHEQKGKEIIVYQVEFFTFGIILFHFIQTQPKRWLENIPIFAIFPQFQIES